MKQVQRRLWQPLGLGLVFTGCQLYSRESGCGPSDAGICALVAATTSGSGGSASGGTSAGSSAGSAASSSNAASGTATASGGASGGGSSSSGGGRADVSQSSLTVVPDAGVPADGVSPLLVTLTLRDDAGVPVGDAPVAVSANGRATYFRAAGDGGAWRLGGVSGMSDGTGTFKAQVVATTAQVETISWDAADGGHLLSGLASFGLASCSFTRVVLDDAGGSSVLAKAGSDLGIVTSDGQQLNFWPSFAGGTFGPVSNYPLTSITNVVHADLPACPGEGLAAGSFPNQTQALVTTLCPTDGGGLQLQNEVTIGTPAAPFVADVGDYTYQGYADLIAYFGGGGQGTVSAFDFLNLGTASGSPPPPRLRQDVIFLLASRVTGSLLAIGASNGPDDLIFILNSSGTVVRTLVVPYVRDMGSGDFIGNGTQELAVLLYSGDLMLFYGSPCGNDFSSAPQMLAIGPFGGSPAALVVADVNHDGAADLVIAQGSDNAVSVLLSNGDATFQAPVTFSTGTDSANAVAVADFNGDGQEDLAVAGSGSVSVFLSGGCLLGDGGPPL